MTFHSPQNTRSSFLAAASLALAVALLLPANGCKAGSSSGSSESSSGSSSSSGRSGGDSAKSGGQASQGGKPGGSGGGGQQLSEPMDATTPQPSAESDDGSPRAVAHTSQAMPGAPQATLKGSQQDKKLDSPESQNAPRANAPSTPQ